MTAEVSDTVAEGGGAPPAGRGWAWRLLGIGAIAVAVAAVVALFLRLRYGVDMFDEAYYVTMPYSFVLGHRPFIDEQHVYQLPGLLMWPLVRAYVAVVGDATGLMLFVRRAWLVFVVGVGAVTFTTLRRMIRWELALLVALLPIVAVPFTIPSLSYNTMGSQLLLLGMVLGARTVVVRDKGPTWLFAAGLVHGLACVAYPTMAIPVVGFGVAILVLFGRESLRPLLAYAGGVLVVAACLLGFFAYVGFDRVRAALAYQAVLPGYVGGSEKFAKIGTQIVKALRPLRLSAAFLLLVGAAFAQRRFGDLARWAVPLAIPLLLFGIIITPTAAALGFIILFGLFSSLFYLLASWDERAKRWWVWGVLVPVLAGLTTGYTSTNGLMNMGIGLTAGLVGGGVLFVLATTKGSEARSWWAAAMLVFTIGVLVFFTYRVVYHDVKIPQETAVVTDGPFKGLHTSPGKKAEVDALLADVRAFGRPNDRVLFFTGLPSGYMFSRMRPATNSIWFAHTDDYVPAVQTMTLDYFKRTGNYPTLVFRRVNPIGYAPDDKVTAWVTANADIVASHEHWTIWRVRETSAAPSL